MNSRRLSFVHLKKLILRSQVLPVIGAIELVDGLFVLLAHGVIILRQIHERVSGILLPPDISEED